jgi:hypothetical protein
MYFGTVLVVENLFRLINQEAVRSQVAIVVSTLVIAALFTPLRRRVQAGIDRRFYRRKYDAEQTLQAFAATLRDEVDLDKLSNHLIGVVQETIQPERVSLWVKQPEKSSSRTDAAEYVENS